MDTLETTKSLLAHIGFPEAQITVSDQEDAIAIVVTLSQQDSGVLIGYHGERIEALKLLLSLMLNQGKSVFTPVSLDVNGYYERRAQSLYELADQAVEKAATSLQEILLPPLSGSERRLVHMYVAEKHPSVTTYSEGEGESRRLIIRPQA
jgi:spoIIIJ-associated protein